VTSYYNGKFVDFTQAVQRTGAKTHTWAVLTVQGHIPVGAVKWFGRWRGYAFFPSAETVFEQHCLRDIARFCEERTREHRLARRVAA